jgi:uncharacterized protein (TIGR02246 family)
MTADEQAIERIVQQLESAWNAHDGARFAAAFADDAHFIQIFGGQLDGRPVIQASHQHIFDTIYKGSHVQFKLRGIRFVRPDIAIVFTHAHLQFNDGAEKREIETRPTLFMAKDAADWHIVTLQNTRISEVPAAARPAARLAT